MNYKNEKHRELFGEAVRRKDKKDCIFTFGKCPRFAIA